MLPQERKVFYLPVLYIHTRHWLYISAVMAVPIPLSMFKVTCILILYGGIYLPLQGDLVPLSAPPTSQLDKLVWISAIMPLIVDVENWPISIA